MQSFSPDDITFMQRALELAQTAEQNGEVPVGAVLTLNNKVIAEAYNQPITLCDPTAHAEMLVLRAAAKKINNYRLLDTTLYVTLEPCAMCAGALVHARVKRLVYATPDLRTGAANSVMNLTAHPSLNHHLQVESNLLAEQSRALLQQFFQKRR